MLAGNAMVRGGRLRRYLLWSTTASPPRRPARPRRPPPRPTRPSPRRALGPRRGVQRRPAPARLPDARAWEGPLPRHDRPSPRPRRSSTRASASSIRSTTSRPSGRSARPPSSTPTAPWPTGAWRWPTSTTPSAPEGSSRKPASGERPRSPAARQLYLDALEALLQGGGQRQGPRQNLLLGPGDDRPGVPRRPRRPRLAGDGHLAERRPGRHRQPPGGRHADRVGPRSRADASRGPPLPHPPLGRRQADPRRAVGRRSTPRPRPGSPTPGTCPATPTPG